MTTAVALAGNNSSISSNQTPGANSSVNTAGSPPPSLYTANNNNINSANTNTALPGHRLQFNRLAAERKTVHVMNANINKDVTKRDRQILASYNQAAASAAGGAGAGGTLSGVGTNLTNVYPHNYQAGQSTLDYNMTTGRSHTNAGSFLQKLSSKFSRR